MSTPSVSTPRRARSTKAKVQQSANGAAPAAPSVKEIVGSRAAPAPMQHQTHGAVTPLTGTITNVSQLMNGGRNIAKGSAGSFETMEDYTAHIESLDLYALRRHALEDAKIVPIDDRQRLIRRLQAAWTTTAARHPGRPGAGIPSRAPFTQAQLDAQNEIRNKLLRV